MNITESFAKIDAKPDAPLIQVAHIMTIQLPSVDQYEDAEVISPQFKAYQTFRIIFTINSDDTASVHLITKQTTPVRPYTTQYELFIKGTSLGSGNQCSSTYIQRKYGYSGDCLLRGWHMNVSDILDRDTLRVDIRMEISERAKTTGELKHALIHAEPKTGSAHANKKIKTEKK